MNLYRRKYEKVFYERNKNEIRKRKLAAYHEKRKTVKGRLSILLSAIKKRTSNPNCKSYQYYGAKGIKCILSLDDLLYLWMRDKAHELRRPSIDRINRFGNYEVPNCRFIEHNENCKLARLVEHQS